MIFVNGNNIFSLSRINDLQKFIESANLKNIDISYLSYLCESIDALEDIRKILYDYFIKETNTTPEKYFNNWIERVNKYCFQGGYGYVVYYGKSTPHHWRIKPEYMNNIEVDDMLRLAVMLTNNYLLIEGNSTYAVWSS